MQKRFIVLFTLTTLSFAFAAEASPRDLRVAHNTDPADDDEDEARIRKLEDKVMALQEEIISLQRELLAERRTNEQQEARLERKVDRMEPKVHVPRPGTAEAKLVELRERYMPPAPPVAPDAPRVVGRIAIEEDITVGPPGERISLVTVGDGPGAIRVTSPNVPGEVYVDGKAIGHAPLVIDGLAAGVHRVEIRVDGEVMRAKVVAIKNKRETMRLVLY